MKNKLMNIFYTFSGNAAFSFIKWLILILIVRLTNTEQVGIYTFAIALTSPIILFTNMRLRIRYVVEDDLSLYNLRHLRNMLNVLSIIVIAMISLIFFREYLVIVLLVALTKLLDLNSELYYSVYHKRAMFKKISILMVIKSIVIIVFFSIALYMTRNLVIGLTIQIISQLVWLIAAEKKSIKLADEIEIKKNVNFRIIWFVFLTGLPLGIVQLLNSYNILIPRYVIEDRLSLSAIGIFAAISYLLTIVDLFMNAISQNFIISIKSRIDNGQFSRLKTFILRDVMIASVILGGSVTVLSYLFGEKIIGIIYGNSYAENSYVLIIISISIIFNFQGWMFDTVLMAFKKYKVQLLTSIITLFISLTASFLLIPDYGLLGASLAVVLITCVQATIKLLIALTTMRNNMKLSSFPNM